MANTNSPKGFKPVGKVGSEAYNGGLSPLPLASGYNTAIYAGDAVTRISTGYINKAGAGDTIIGIAAGVEWVGSDGVPRKQNYWPASTATLGSQDATIYVQADPMLEVEARFTNATTVPTTALIGEVFNLVDAGGSAATGISGEGIDISATGSTSAKTFRFVRFAPRADNDTASAYSVGVFQIALHQNNSLTGV